MTLAVLLLAVAATVPDLSNSPDLKPVAGRVEVGVSAGKREFALKLNMPPRILESQAPAVEDVDAVSDLDTMKPNGYTRFFMTWHTPEMSDLVRRTAAATIMRGPLVLAKGRAVGTSRGETLGASSINRQPGWRASLAQADTGVRNSAVWGMWMLSLERGDEKRCIPVGDFWSVSRGDDSTNWFSLWF